MAHCDVIDYSCSLVVSELGLLIAEAYLGVLRMHKHPAHNYEKLPIQTWLTWDMVSYLTL